MSDVPEPEKPAAPPVGPAARARARRPPRRPEPVKTAIRAEELPWLRPLLIFGGIALVAVHLVFGRDDFTLRDRALAVIPLFPLLWEIHRYSLVPRGTQLPFAAYALFYNYLTFSWPALFNTTFKDLSGPVTFSDDARFGGTAAVALNSLMIYAGIRLGEVVGKKAQPTLLRLYPPAVVPNSFSKAVTVYAFMCVAATELNNRAFFPSSIIVLLAMSLSLTYMIGLTLAKPESFRGPWSRYLSWVALASGAVGGLLTGMLEPLFRLSTTVFAARWTHLRRFSIVGVVALVSIYAILQPVKGKFREQVWVTRGGQEAPTYAERIGAWSSAIESLWSGRDVAQTSSDAAVSRFLELDPVLHAFTMLPGRVRPAEGAAWMNIVYAPIPRIFWPGKPKSNDLTLSYGVAFNLQSELGARSTAILLSLIIDGYWNFGWPGIVFVSVLAGLWVGVCQRMYVSDHWAMKASAVALFGQIYIIGSFALLYAGLVQMVAGAILASWMVYRLAVFLEVRETAPIRFIPRRAAPPRRLPEQ